MPETEGHLGVGEVHDPSGQGLQGEQGGNDPIDDVRAFHAPKLRSPKASRGVGYRRETGYLEVTDG